MSNFFTFKLWFSLYPGPLTKMWQYALIVIVIIFLASIVVTWKFYNQNKKTLYAKLWLSGYNFALTGTIIGALLLFFCYESVPFLSSRFWFLLWAIGQGFWAYIIFKRLKQLPKIKETIAAKKEFNKYVP
ncbi:MAG: hypothetical protein WCV41_00775 [Patescibacteria group bacterium]